MIKYILSSILIFAICSLPADLFAQVLNDECFGAIRLENTSNFCSSEAAFNNFNATPSVEMRPTCWPDDGFVDVWYSFIAQGNAVTLSILGNTSPSPGGTISNPEVALYSGSCQAGLVEEECSSDATNANFVEMYAFGLVPGGTYYLRVSARVGSTGTFQMCINSFNEVPEPSGDCATAVLLCDKSPFGVEFLIGGGNDITEIQGASCLVNCGGGTEETGSTWYKWTCKDPGTLAFTLLPNNPNDDLDFILYRLPNGVDNCNGKEELVCMASGENVGAPLADWEACTGATGMSLTDGDQSEECGCQSGDNNFVQAINMVAGESYALVVNNFSPSNSGFTISWGGTGTFLGPEAAFSINPPVGVTCDEPLTVIDNSSFASGSIVSYFWSFGEGANPPVANTPNPPPVVYNSFGTKYIALTIESDGGCVVTEILEIEVDECCRLASDIGIDLVDVVDPICADTESGSVEVTGTGGDPFYSYSIDGGLYTPSPLFNGLADGIYEVVVQDIKGCRDTLEADLMDPPALSVDAGPDTTVTLGEFADLNAVGAPASLITNYSWDPAESLSCGDCTDPTAVAPGTTTYTVTVSNIAGCTASDEVTVFVSEERPIYIPNAISPNDDGFNDFFTLYGGNAAKEIEELRVFNRWGALVFEARNIALGDERLGWDGYFKGKAVGPDVYAFYAKVAFIDDVVLLYEGSITVIK